MQTNPAVEQNKTLNGQRVRGISPVGKEKVCGGITHLPFCNASTSVANCNNEPRVMPLPHHLTTEPKETLLTTVDAINPQ